MAEKSGNYTALTRKLITDANGLGYCCVWFFLTRFRKTPVIAARLGVSERTVREWKQRVRCGQETCAGADNCMDKVVTMKLTKRKPSGERLE